MPRPNNQYRYVGKVYRPSGHVTEELFISVADAQREAQHRAKHGVGAMLSFVYDTPGLSLTMNHNGVPYYGTHDVRDRLDPGSVIELRAVRKTGEIDPMPQFRVTVGPRGGTSSVRLHPGKES